MHNGKTGWRWLCVISGFLILTATAEKLPPPDDKEYTAKEIAAERIQLAGKIVKVKFNRAYYVLKRKNGLYAGNLRSSEKPRESGDYSVTTDAEGEQVVFAPEGLGVFLKFIAEPGCDDVSLVQRQDQGAVYIQVGGGTNRSVAVGDEYKKTGDEEAYQWSVKTEIPDLAAKSKVSVSDALLFPDQLNGKVVAIEFYDAGKIEQKSAQEYRTFISCGRGHAEAWINFPAAGLAFFKKIAGQEKFNKACTVYARINVSPKGFISLEAKGLRVFGEGNNTEYRW
jgi:hypothetical protein